MYTIRTSGNGHVHIYVCLLLTCIPKVLSQPKELGPPLKFSARRSSKLIFNPSSSLRVHGYKRKFVLRKSGRIQIYLNSVQKRPGNKIKVKVPESDGIPSIHCCLATCVARHPRLPELDIETSILRPYPFTTVTVYNS